MLRPAVVLCLVLSLSTGCNSKKEMALENQVQVLRSRLIQAQTSLRNVESEVSSLQQAVDNLTSAVDDFDYYDWGTVIRSVESAATDVKEAADATETAVADAVSTME